MAESFLQRAFGGELLAESIWRRAFGRELLAESFWRRAFVREYLAESFLHRAFGRWLMVEISPGVFYQPKSPCHFLANPKSPHHFLPKFQNMVLISSMHNCSALLNTLHLTRPSRAAAARRGTLEHPQSSNTQNTTTYWSHYQVFS